MPKCKWLKPACGRETGKVEENEEWLVERWEKAGLVERLPDEPEKVEKSVDAPPVDKAMKPDKVKKK